MKKQKSIYIDIKDIALIKQLAEKLDKSDSQVITKAVRLYSLDILERHEIGT